MCGSDFGCHELANFLLFQEKQWDHAGTIPSAIPIA